MEVDMPPKVKISKEEILTAALDIVRKEGVDALNARGLATVLGCSTQPIFCNYAGMDALREDVLGRAYLFYYKELEAAMAEGRYPAYKASGMFYIGFAVREPQLFQWLFMRRRSATEQAQGFSAADEGVLAALMSAAGLTRQQAEEFHFTMWMWVHGVATTMAGGFLAYDEEQISALLSNVYFGLRARYSSEKGGAV
jgi:AcrR family transcriptional regulator